HRWYLPSFPTRRSSDLVVNAVLLRPMPYSHPEQLYALKGGQSWPDLYDIQQQAHSLYKIGAYAPWQFDLVGSGEPKLVDAALVRSEEHTSELQSRFDLV